AHQVGRRVRERVEHALVRRPVRRLLQVLHDPVVDAPLLQDVHDTPGLASAGVVVDGQLLSGSHVRGAYGVNVGGPGSRPSPCTTPVRGRRPGPAPPPRPRSPRSTGGPVPGRPTSGPRGRGGGGRRP